MSCGDSLKFDVLVLATETYIWLIDCSLQNSTRSCLGGCGVKEIIVFNLSL